MRLPTGNFGYRTPQGAPGVRPPMESLTNNGAEQFANTAARVGTGLMVAEAEERDRQERHESAMRIQRADEAKRVQAMEVQADTLNNLTAVTDGVTKGIADGSIDKTTAQKTWTEQVTKLIPEKLAVIPDELDRRRVQATLSEPMARFNRIVSDTVDKKNQTDIEAGMLGYLEGMERYALTDPDYAIKSGVMAIESMGPKAGMSSDQVQVAKSKFTERVASTGYANFLVNNMYDPAALAQAQKAIGSDSLLTPEAKNQLLARTQSYIERADRAIDAEQKKVEGAKEKQNAIVASDLEIAVKRGQAGYKEIEQSFNQQVITPAKRTELTTWLDNEQQKQGEKARKTQEQRQRVSGALSGMGFLDYRQAEDRDAVDAYFSDVLGPSLKDMQPGDQLNAVAGFAGKVGMVPRPVQEQMRGALRAGSPEAKAQAADFLDRLSIANPAVLDDFSANDIALGNAIAANVRAGADAKTAVNLANAALAVPESERKTREVRYREEKATESNRKRLNNEFTKGWFSNSPGKVPDAMTGEFEAVTYAEYLRTGDLEVAQKTATDQLRKVWGVTLVDEKPKWMKYAPEVIYKVEGADPKWIREQLHHDLTQNAVMAPGITFTLIADSMTGREALPSYPVFMRKDGALEPVIGPDGKPQRFRPDYATSPEGRRREDEAIQNALKDYNRASDRYTTMLTGGKASREELDRAKAEADAQYKRLEKLRAP